MHFKAANVRVEVGAQSGIFFNTFSSFSSIFFPISFAVFVQSWPEFHMSDNTDVDVSLMLPKIFATSFPSNFPSSIQGPAIKFRMFFLYGIEIMQDAGPTERKIGDSKTVPNVLQCYDIKIEYFRYKGFSNFLVLTISDCYITNLFSEKFCS